MTIHKQMVTQPAKQYEETISVSCDICGKDHKGAQEDSEGVNWGNSYNDMDATGVYIKAGYGYSDCGSHRTTHYHICPTCMKKHVLPFVASLTKNPLSNYVVDW